MANQMQIKIIDVEIGNGTTKTNKPYQFLEVSYKNQSFQDKVETKKVMPFGDKDVYKALEKATKGQIYTVSREKNGDGFWEWTEVKEGENENMVAEKAVAKSTSTTAKGTWETPEERATKQLYIIRQSCLSQSVNTLTNCAKPGTEINPESVTNLANYYVDFVLGTEDSTNSDSDLPY